MHGKIKLDPTKPTILICSDSATIHTGLARVVREIFIPLFHTGRYNIIQHGWFHLQPVEHVPWQVILTEKDARTGAFAQNDKHGEQSFSKVVAAVQPDIVFAFADPWHLGHLVGQPNRNYHTIAYTCVDSEGITKRAKETFERCDTLVLFGDWAKRVVLHDERFNVNPAKVHTIPHGVDIAKFYPDPDVSEIRAELMKSTDDDIVIGCVARNQPRKNLGRFFQLAHHLLYGTYSYCKDCNQYSHWPYDIVSATAHQVSNCAHCKSNNLEDAQPNPKLHFYYHGHPAEDHGWNVFEMIDRYKLHGHFHIHPEVSPIAGVTDEYLRKIYSAIDIFTIPTRCEGFGLPILEAMACGKPLVLPKYSAYLDWTRDCTQYVSGEIYVEPGLGCDRMEIYMDDYIEQTLALINNPETRTLLGTNARATAEQYHWKDIVDKFDQLFQDCLSKDIHRPLEVSNL